MDPLDSSYTCPPDLVGQFITEPTHHLPDETEESSIKTSPVGVPNSPVIWDPPGSHTPGHNGHRVKEQVGRGEVEHRWIYKPREQVQPLFNYLLGEKKSGTRQWH